MKIAFCTCVQLGLSCIQKIHDLGGKFDLFITLNDDIAKKKSGRIYLNDISKKSGTQLLKVNHINDTTVIKTLKKLEIDWLFLIGWSQIASVDVLNSCKSGVIGAHPTLLPIGRGRAAIPWAIIKGLNKTGVTFFKMDEGVDTGNILGQIEIDIDKKETSGTLYEKVNLAHEDLIKNIWPDLIENKLKHTVQDDKKATFWPGRKPKDGKIIPKEMTINQVDRLVRATTKPYPGAFIIDEKNNKKIIWEGTKNLNVNGVEIECKDGIFIATKTETIEIK